MPMYTLKTLALTSLLALSRYDGSGGCVANFAQSSVDMAADLGSGLQVTPTRISVSTGASLQLDGGLALAGQSVQLKQGAAAVPLGALDGQGRLQKTLGKTELATLALGTAQVVTSSGAQVAVRLYIEPKLDNAPALYPVGRVMKAEPTPVWVGVARKKILTLDFRDASKTGLIRQSIGEYLLDVNSLINISQTPTYKNYSSPVFTANYSDQGSKFYYLSTGAGLTTVSFFLAEYDATGPQAVLLNCPLDAGCSAMLTVRPYIRVTSLTSDPTGAIFAAIVTTSGSPAALKAFSEGTLGTAIDVVGASTALPHETMLGVGRLSDDETPDLMALLPTGAVAIWLGGQGRLTASDALTAAVQQALAGVTAPSALALGDVDGDGLDDIVVASNAQLVLLMNQGGGRFSTLAGPTVPVGLAPVTAIAVGDVSVSGKGIADLVLASKDQHSIGAIENSASY